MRFTVYHDPLGCHSPPPLEFLAVFFDKDSIPLANVSVELIPEKGRPIQLSSDANGVCGKSLEPGSWTLKVNSEKGSWAGPIRISSGWDTEISLVLGSESRVVSLIEPKDKLRVRVETEVNNQVVNTVVSGQAAPAGRLSG